MAIDPRGLLFFLAASTTVLGPACIAYPSANQESECAASTGSWCVGDSVAECTLSPDCINHPDTCSPNLIVTNNHTCSGARPVCVQAGADATCVMGDAKTCATTSMNPNLASGPVGDFNGDGFGDFVGQALSFATIYLGRGDGTFSSRDLPPLPALAYPFFAADANGDGHTDLLVTAIVDVHGYGVGDSVYVLAGHGDGSFAAPVLFAPAPSATAPVTAIADLDGDAIDDVIALDRVACNAFVTLGGTTPRALPPQHLTSCPAVCGGCRLDAVADFNGDYKKDVVLDTDTGFVVIFGGAGGTLSMGAVVEVAANADAYIAGDVDGDGRMDIGTSAAGSVSFLHGHGDGTFDPPAALPGSPYQEMLMLLSDVDGDGRVDFVTLADRYALAIRLGTGSGLFAAATYYQATTAQLTALPIRSSGPKSLLLDGLIVFPSKCY